MGKAMLTSKWNAPSVSKSNLKLPSRNDNSHARPYGHAWLIEIG